MEATSNIEKADMLNSFFSKCFNPSGVLGENAGYSINPGPSGVISDDEDLYCNVEYVEELLLKVERAGWNIGKNAEVHCCLYRTFSD